MTPEEKNAYAKKYYEANKEKLAAYQAEYQEENKAEIAAKRKVRNAKPENKAKLAAKQAAHYEENKAKIAAKKAAYYEENKAKIAAKNALPESKAKKKEYRDTYYEANKEKLAAKRALPEIKEAVNEYQKKRCAENPGIANYKNFLAAIWSFRKFGGNYGAKAFEKAGFTGKDLNERLLPFGKSWDDMEGEHLDHIIPVSSFGYPLPGDANYLACYGLDNLQLLTAEENRAKGAKLDQPKK